jgi:3-oxoacyl-[acyl-carrier protein] reductase
MDLQLKDRVYIVTGATSGLGLASARALLDEGACVQVSSRSAANVEKVVSELSSDHGDRVRGLPADNGDPDVGHRLVDEALQAWGRLDGALVSVGGPPGGSAGTATDEQWRTAFESVFLGSLRLVRAATEKMTDGAAIALVLSSSVRQPILNLAISNGLRPGLAMTAKTLADELGPRGIRVVSLVPGRIATPRTLEVDHAGSDSEARNKAIPLGRMGVPEEFGRVAAFVLSPMASYITGSIVTVDGGLIRAL